MKHAILIVMCWISVLGASTPMQARPASEPIELTPGEPSEDMVGDLGATLPVSKVLEDTIWIADWSFDTPGSGCTDAGWIKYDNRINDGSNYWRVEDHYSGMGGITGNAAVLSKHDPYWPQYGYGNLWDYSIILKYKGASTLSFKYLSDTEPGYDYVTIETDSGGASESRVNYAVNPSARPEQFRVRRFLIDGWVPNGSVTLSLPDLGAPQTVHEVYIRLESDGGGSDEDGFYPSFLAAGLVVDNIQVTGSMTYSESFEGALNPNVMFANTAPATPFGEWARVYPHITDNDVCTENTTCAWLWTDPTLPAYFPDMAFGPGGSVVRRWLDDIIVSPWTSLASTPGQHSTSLMFRRFAGSNFGSGRIVQNWSVRTKGRFDNTDTPAPGDSFDAVSPWGHATQWNALNNFNWGDVLDVNTLRPPDMTPYVLPDAREIQLRFRVADWAYIAGAGNPVTLNPGPGPFIDRVRIGRRAATGPEIDAGLAALQAQDCFPTAQIAGSNGEHFLPDGANRFGSCAFSCGLDLASASNPRVVTGDSIVLHRVTDARGAGITSVLWHGAILAGPHAGKAPTPYVVGANGFFTVTPDSARFFNMAVVQGRFVVDFDDTYFRGGDALQYFWSAQDGAGGFSSCPPGLSGLPASVAAAEAATGGLIEVDYLPTIEWSPAYLARIAADPYGDLDPNAEEIAGSAQANCILYYQHSNSARRSGDRNRTHFMYTLDRLGYRGHYDVYDVQGYGNTNNQLGGRANVQQASGYALIIEDDGRSNLVPNIPDGTPLSSERVNQAQWYRNYLAQGISGLAGTASLWIIGENTAFESAANALFSQDMGLASVVANQGTATSPNVVGVAPFTWANDTATDFVNDQFMLAGGCPVARFFDAANASGTAVRTHSYASGPTIAGGAIVMNRNAAFEWNTIWQGFSWFDIRSMANSATDPDAQEVLTTKILGGVLPAACLRSPNPATEVPGDPSIAVPRVTALYQNTPNPFNPATTIRFDLAQAGRVELRVFDVAGRLVRTLVDRKFEAKAGHVTTWNGMDGSGRRVPSGVYFYRLAAPDFVATRKLVLLE